MITAQKYNKAIVDLYARKHLPWTRDNTLVTPGRRRYDYLSDLEAKTEDEMTNRYRDAKHALWTVSEEIYDYAYDYYSLPSDWDRTDIFITSEPAAVNENSGAGRLVMVTSAAPQIAWLFGRLRDAFTSLGKGGLESQHYLRLGGVARAYELTSDREYKVNGILRAVVNEADVILEEMQREEIEPATRLPEMVPPSVPSLRGNSRWQEAVVC
jgi:hypothetical protein